MKIIRHELGHYKTAALTCRELMFVLQHYPPDMPVFAECEGCWTSILDNCRVDKMENCHPEDVCEILVFDTDFNR